MRSNVIASLMLVCLLAACAGAPVRLGDTGTRPMPTGQSRVIESQACGFQLLLLIPININDRARRAYDELVAQAKGDFITDVQVREEWTYAFVGTGYCTKMRATAIAAAS